MTIYSTNFDTDQNPLVEGGTWEAAAGPTVALQVVGGIAYPTATANEGTARYVAATIGPNQYAEITSGPSWVAGGAIFCSVRLQTGDVYTGYRIDTNFSTALCRILRGTYPSYTVVKSRNISAWTAGGSLRAHAQGPCIAIVANGTLVLAAIDPTYATGQPGIGAEANATVTTQQLTAASVGDLSFWPGVGWPKIEQVAHTHVETAAIGINAAIPDNFAVGEMLLMIVVKATNTAMTWPGSPVLSTIANADGPDGTSNIRVEARYRIVDGTESWGDTGNTINLTAGANAEWASWCYRISGVDPTAAPECAAATGSTLSAACPALTPSFGAQNTLWIAYGGALGTLEVTGWPSGAQPFQDFPLGDDTVTPGSVTHMAAARSENVGTMTPGAFTNTTGAWRALTIAVPPVLFSNYAYARPVADVTVDNWQEDDGTTTAIYDQIDEAVADDADYIRTQVQPTNDVYVCQLGSFTDPASSAYHHVSLRYGKDTGAGQPIDLTVQLRQGYTTEGSPGTLIATPATLTNIAGPAWTGLSYTLSGAEADAITNYASLFIRLLANAPGGTPGAIAVTDWNEGATLTAATTHTVARTLGVAGNLVILIFAYNIIGQTIGWPAGWTPITGFKQEATGIGWDAAWRVDTGGEGSTLAGVTTSLSTRACNVAYSVSNACSPTGQPPQITTAGTATSNAPNPPSLSPTGGSKAYAFIAAFAQAGEEADDDTWCTAAPTNYTNLIQKATGTTGATTTNCQIASAFRLATTATEDPSTFATAQSLLWLAQTIAIHPMSPARAQVSWLEFRAPAVAATVDLAATIVMSGAITPMLSRAVGLAAPVSVSSTLSDGFPVARALTSTLTALNTLAAALTLQGQVALDANVSATSTLTAALGVAKSISATLAATGTLSAQAIAARALGSPISGAGNLSAALSIQGQVQLAATIAATGTITGGLSIARALEAFIDVLQALIANVGKTQPLTATITGTSTLTANLQRTVEMISTVAGASALTGQATAARTLASLLAGTSTLTAQDTVARALQSLIAETGALSAALTTTPSGTAALASTLSATGTLSATLAITRALQAPIAGAGTLAAQAAITRALQAPVVGTSSLTAQATITRALQSLIAELGTLSTALTVTGAIQLAAVLSAQGALSAALSTPVHLAGLVAAQGQLIANLNVLGPLVTMPLIVFIGPSAPAALVSTLDILTWEGSAAHATLTSAARPLLWAGESALAALTSTVDILTWEGTAAHAALTSTARGGG